MRALNEMRNQSDIAKQRKRLTKEVKRCEKACTADVAKVREAWSGVSRLVSMASSSFSYVMAGLSIAKRVFSKKGSN